MTRKLFFPFALIMLWTPPVAATEFCVSTAMELQSALLQAQSNGQPDKIRIERGHYSTAENGIRGLGFSYSSIENLSLTITGGYAEGCLGFRGSGDAFTTVLDGGNVHRVLAILAGDSNAMVSVRNLTIQSGYTYSNELPAGGLLIKGFGDDAPAQRVNIDRVAFIGNESAAGISALMIESQGRVDISNNLFHDNTVNSLYTAAVDRGPGSSAATYFINNTVVNNTTLNNDGIAGVWLKNTSGSGNVAANNVFWNNNGISDLVMSGPVGNISNNHMLHNIVQNPLGLGGTNIGNSTTNPLLDIDFSLLQDSPARDTGFTPPDNPLNPPLELDWDPGLFDIGFGLRVLGPSVDRGAFEYRDQIFADSFE